MSYEKITIKQAIDNIDQKKIYLPALQRKFVWGKHQIELLFDSIMRNYPFGTFLFWHLHRQKAENYVFYEFLDNYDERTPYNKRKEGAFSQTEIDGVLDGQQRLSSLYIGLMGTHTERTPYGRRWNPEAYPKMSLHLNLLSLPYVLDANNCIQTNEENNFEFKFMTEEGVKTLTERRKEKGAGSVSENESMYWMKVGKVLSWNDDPDFEQIVEDLMTHCATDKQREAISGSRRFVKRGLETLHKRVRDDALINYYSVAKDDLEDILKIFVRVNSGGTVLSKTDLLFSTIVATWDNGREEIENALKTINKKGDGFNFGNEYLMRCCLVLSDGPTVYKVNSFKSENVQRIRDEWPNIAAAVSRTVDLLVEYGFSGSVLTSQNATIILAYYIYKGGSLDKESKKGLQKYLIHALLNGVYGSSQDQLISALRNGLRQETKTEAGGMAYRLRNLKFSFDDLLKIELPQQKRLSVTEPDIERFLLSTKGPASFFVLSLLYPQLRFNEVLFHQDHIHPANGFSNENIKEMGLSDAQRQEWCNCRDCVPNLQLMEGRQNESKNATPLVKWIGQMRESERAIFAASNYFPDGVGLEFKEFMSFYQKRKEILRGKLRNVLTMTSQQPVEGADEWGGRDDEIEVQGGNLPTEIDR